MTNKKKTVKSKRIDTAVLVAIIGVVGTLLGIFLTPIAPELAKRWFPSPTVSVFDEAETTIPSTVAAEPAMTGTPEIVNVPEFSDNFNTGISSQWENTQPWMRENDMLTLKRGVTQARIVIGDLSWKNYTIEVDATSGGDDFSSYLAGVVVRYQNEENFVQFVLDCDFPDTEIYWQYVKNDIPKIDEGSMEKYSQCTPYHIIVVVMDNTFNAYLNGEIASTFDSDDFPSGKVGLLSGYNYGEFPAAFDNFVLRP